MQHLLILIPGLGDDMMKISSLSKGWQKDKVKVHIHNVYWQKDKINFQNKLMSLLTCIDRYSKNYTVSLIGISAGGSLAIAAFEMKKSKIHRLVTVSSRLLKGERLFPSLKLSAKINPAFHQAVIYSDRVTTTLSEEEKQKILTLRGLWDEAVPVKTSTIQGANNIQMKTIFHVANHLAAVTYYRKHILRFLEIN